MQWIANSIEWEIQFMAKNYEVVNNCIVIFTKMFVGWQELCIMYMHQNSMSLNHPLSITCIWKYMSEASKSWSYYLSVKLNQVEINVYIQIGTTLLNSNIIAHKIRWPDSLNKKNGIQEDKKWTWKMMNWPINV